ncbi:MAG TPA: DUF3619 family protein [Rudaea sp.]|jgi:hypothetical protein|nr:DUF3619 family protein [Rudaea sp.]
MNDDDDLPNWTPQAKQALDESAQNLDAATLSRLNRARQRALGLARPRRMRSWFVPAGLASACAVLLAVAVVWHRPTAPPNAADPFIPGTSAAAPSGGFSASDLDLVSSDDGIEFYQDLDFYAWLDAQGQDNNG